jgi:hypothetical protein
MIMNRYVRPLPPSLQGFANTASLDHWSRLEESPQRSLCSGDSGFSLQLGGPPSYQPALCIKGLGLVPIPPFSHILRLVPKGGKNA